MKYIKIFSFLLNTAIKKKIKDSIPAYRTTDTGSCLEETSK